MKSLEIDCQHRLLAKEISELAAAQVPLEQLIILNCLLRDKNTDFVNGIVGLTRLKHLELRLVTNLKKCDILAILTNLNELEYMFLWAYDLNFTSTDLAELLQSSAPKLSKLELCTSTTYKFELDEVFYKRILDVVQKRQAKTTFELILWKLKPPKDTALEKLLKANESTLKITLR